MAQAARQKEDGDGAQSAGLKGKLCGKPMTDTYYVTGASHKHDTKVSQSGVETTSLWMENIGSITERPKAEITFQHDQHALGIDAPQVVRVNRSVD